MDFSQYKGTELIGLYSDLLCKMKKQGLIRSKNVVGDLGEYIVIDYYTKTTICSSINQKYRCNKY